MPYSSSSLLLLLLSCSIPLCSLIVPSSPLSSSPQLFSLFLTFPLPYVPPPSPLPYCILLSFLPSSISSSPRQSSPHSSSFSSPILWERSPPPCPPPLLPAPHSFPLSPSPLLLPPPPPSLWRRPDCKVRFAAVHLCVSDPAAPRRAGVDGNTGRSSVQSDTGVIPGQLVPSSQMQP